MDPDGDIPGSKEILCGFQAQIGQLIGTIGSISLDAAYRQMAEVERTIAFQPQAFDELQGFLSRQLPGRPICFIERQHILVESPKAVGCSACFRPVGYLRKPNGLNGFMEGLCGVPGHSSADGRHLIKLGAANYVFLHSSHRVQLVRPSFGIADYSIADNGDCLVKRLAAHVLRARLIQRSQLPLSTPTDLVQA